MPSHHSARRPTRRIRIPRTRPSARPGWGCRDRGIPSRHPRSRIFDFGGYAAHIRDYLDRLGTRSDVSGLDLTAMRAAIDELEHAGQDLGASARAARAAGNLDPALADEVNRGMMSVEHNWLTPEGIPGRPWYKHLLCLPLHLRAPRAAGIDGSHGERQPRARAAAGRCSDAGDPRKRRAGASTRPRSCLLRRHQRARRRPLSAAVPLRSGFGKAQRAARPAYLWRSLKEYASVSPIVRGLETSAW